MRKRQRKNKSSPSCYCEFIGGLVLIVLFAVIITVPLVTRDRRESVNRTEHTTPPFQCNDTMAALPQFLMDAPPGAPSGATVMFCQANNSIYYASGNRGVILSGQYLWPINPDTLAIGANLYPSDYPWEDQITGMGYWANGNRFIFAERNYANLWSTNLLGGDVQHLLALDRERRGIAIRGDLAYLCNSGVSPPPYSYSIAEINLNTNTTVRYFNASDEAGFIQGAGGMTTHPITGDVWISWVPEGVPFGNAPRWIGTINLETGVCTRMCNGPFLSDISGIAFDNQGRLWITLGGQPPGAIYRYNGGTPCLCPS